jgi:hypothetical protein
VPSSNEAIFDIGSTSPGAILYDACEFFSERNPKAGENLKSIKSSLRQAVDLCIEAAGNEFDLSVQKSLMRGKISLIIISAASYGKSFLDGYTTKKFTDMARYLRILNSIRSYDVGIPLTYDQLISMTVEKLVQILTNRRHYGLAKAVCEYLTLPVESVLIHWASVQVKMPAGDERLLSQSIFDKFSLHPGISFANVAKEAYKAGKVGLATNVNYI